MFVFISVPLELFLVYVAAARLLRRALGPEAPNLNTLLTQEFTNRRAKSIAEEYLELHGHPTLRACRRALAKNRRPVSKAKVRPRVNPMLQRSLPRSITTVDPGRN